MFKVEIDKFGEAASRVEHVEQDIRVATERTSAVNSAFISVMIGLWADEENRACILLENNLRVFHWAMLRMSNRYTAALSKLQGTMTTTRNNVMSAIHSTTSDTNRIVLADGFNVVGYCSYTEQALSALDVAAQNAISALSGLDDSGGIQGQLESLRSEVAIEVQTITNLSTAYTAHEKGVDDFEKYYAQELNPDKFIQDWMLSVSSREMKAAFAASPIGQVSSAAKDFKDGDLKKAKNTFNFIGKTLDQLESGVTAYRSIKDSFSKVGEAFIGALDNYDCTGDVVFALKHGAKDVGSSLWGATKGTASAWWKSLLGNKTFKEKFGGKFAEAFGLFSEKQRGRIVTETFGNVDEFIDSASNIAKHTDADSVIHSLSKVGTRVKTFARGIGYVGDAIELFHTGAKAQEAYATTIGDEYQKSAAAGVEVVQGLAKFGVGKAAGAVVGFIFGGGPVGAVAGMAIGSVIDKGLKAASDWFDKSEAKQNIIDGVGGFFRNVFGGGKQSAFAAG